MSSKAKLVTKLSVAGLVGVFLTVFLYMADLVYYPAFFGTMMAFPEADMGVLNFIMTGSQLTAAIAAFAVIPLMRFVPKKTLLLVLIAIFAVFALATPLVNDVWYVAVMRTLSGLGFGGLMGVSVSLLQQVYRDNAAKRDRLVGWYNGFMSLSGAVNGLAGGFLAAVSWNAVFQFYWIAVPIFIVIAIFVPKTPADKDDAGAIAEAEAMAAAASEMPESAGGGWGGTLPSVIAAAVSYGIISCIYLACGSGQLSVIAFELGIGGEETAGMITAAASVAGFIAGMVFAPVYHKVGRFLPAILFAFMVAGIGLYCVHANAFFIYAGFCLDAFAYAGGISYYMVYVAEVAPPAKASTAITAVTIGMTLGGFISPYVVTAIQGILGTAEIMPIYPILIVGAIIALVLAIILGIRSKKKGEVFGQAEPTMQ